jgi:hypothetical protein
MGVCPKCGLVCYGWILRNPQHQKCRECGTRLDIRPYATENVNDNERKPSENDKNGGRDIDK